MPASHAKNGEVRVVPLNADALAVIREWIEADKHHVEYVFSFRGKALIVQVATRMWRRACTSAGLPGFRFHDLRHTWASWQSQAGTPMQFIQELGGWKSLPMVQRYSHLAASHLASYADRTTLSHTKGGTVRQLRKKAVASS